MLSDGGCPVFQSMIAHAEVTRARMTVSEIYKRPTTTSGPGREVPFCSFSSGLNTSTAVLIASTAAFIGPVTVSSAPAMA